MWLARNYDHCEASLRSSGLKWIAVGSGTLAVGEPLCQRTMPTLEPSAQVQEPEVITKGDADATDLQTKEDERQDSYHREGGGRQTDWSLGRQLLLLATWHLWDKMSQDEPCGRISDAVLHLCVGAEGEIQSPTRDVEGSQQGQLPNRKLTLLT